MAFISRHLLRFLSSDGMLSDVRGGGGEEEGETDEWTIKVNH